MASTTTIASSTTIPIASTMPKSERLLIENPNPFIAANVQINETGIAIRGMIAARQFWRKIRTTRTTSDRFEQRFLHFVDRFTDRNCWVVNNRVVESGRKTLFEFGHFLPNRVGSGERI